MRNEYRIEGNEVYITLRSKIHTETIISLEDLPPLLDKDCIIYLLGNYASIEFLPWSLKHRARLHRFIMEAPKDKQVDHINRNPLDNRRSNLRIVTSAQNLQNLGARKNTLSGRRGVRLDAGKWKATVMVGGKNHYLGCYETVEEASKVVSNYRAVLQPYSSDAIEIENPVVSEQRVAVNNKSGITGITWSKSQQKWRVFLQVNKKQHYGGTFDDIESAKIGLERLKQKIGYNRQHPSLNPIL